MASLDSRPGLLSPGLISPGYVSTAGMVYPGLGTLAITGYATDYGSVFPLTGALLLSGIAPAVIVHDASRPPVSGCVVTPRSSSNPPLAIVTEPYERKGT